MAALFALASCRTRLISILAVLAVALGVISPAAQMGLAAGLSAASDNGERWLGVAQDDNETATIELRQDAASVAARDGGAAAEARDSSPAPHHPIVLSRTAHQRLQLPVERPPPPVAAVASHSEAPEHRRPDPTGPPLLG